MLIACPTCEIVFNGVPDASSIVTCPNGHWFAPHPVGAVQNADADQKAAPAPTQGYYVTREPGRRFVRTVSANQVRELMAMGILQESFYATESDGRSFTQFQRDGDGGRWRTLSELLAEWGETLPRPTPATARLPWHIAPCAALAGAFGCLLMSALVALLMYGIGWLLALVGVSSFPLVTFATSRESILFVLILSCVAGMFGAIRGLYHAGMIKCPPADYMEIAGKAIDDLASIRGPHGSFERTFEMIACLFMAGVLALPVIILVLLVWFAR